jgi:hypothetical protein
MNFKITPLVVVAALVGAYLLLGKRGLDLDLADVKPSGQSFMTVGAMAVIFIIFGKYLTEKFYVKGLSEVFAKV